jgi:hypothetical protein
LISIIRVWRLRAAVKFERSRARSGSDAQLVGVELQGIDDELDVLGEIDAQQLRAHGNLASFDLGRAYVVRSSRTLGPSGA